MFSHSDDIIDINDLNLDINNLNIQLGQKSFEIILIYDFAHKISYEAKPLRIISDKVYGYIRKYAGTIYLRSFNSDERYKIIFDRIRFFMCQKVIVHTFIVMNI